MSWLHQELQVFNITIDEVIEEAYERCGVRTNSGYDIKSARRSLNLLFSEWGNRGINLWKVKSKTETLVNGSVTYNTPSDCNDVLKCCHYIWRQPTDFN